MVATPTPGSLFAVTRQAVVGQYPIAITADLVGEMTWLEIGALVRAMEREFLAPQLALLGRRLATSFPLPRGVPRDLLDGWRLARAYAHVLDQLGRTKPQAAGGLVRLELAAIRAGRRAESSLFARSLDYGVFRKRGPYRRQLAWVQLMLGRPDAAAVDVRRFDARLTAALLLCRTLLIDGQASGAWERFHQTMRLLIGGQHLGDAVGFMAAARQAFGDLLPLTALAQPDRWDEFSSLLSRLRGRGGRAGLVLLGAHRLKDFELIAQFGWPHVGTPSMRREDPGGLDLMAVYGSRRASQILLARHTDTPHFVRLLRRARKRHLPLPAALVSERVRTLYQAGFHAMQALLLDPPRGGPLPRWRGPWRDRAISSALGFWLRLRNLPKRGRALPQAGRPSRVVLEPAAQFYARLAALVETYDQRLGAAGVSAKLRAGLAPLAAELSWMRDHAVALLSGVRPRQAQNRRLADVWVRWAARPVHGEAGERFGERLFYLWSPAGKTEEVRAGLAGSLRLQLAWPVGPRRVIHLGAAYAYRERKQATTASGPLPLPDWLRRSELIVLSKQKEKKR